MLHPWRDICLLFTSPDPRHVPVLRVHLNPPTNFLICHQPPSRPFIHPRICKPRFPPIIPPLSFPHPISSTSKQTAFTSPISPYRPRNTPSISVLPRDFVVAGCFPRRLSKAFYYLQMQLGLGWYGEWDGKVLGGEE